MWTTPNTARRPSLLERGARSARSTQLLILAAALSIGACRDPTPAGSSAPPAAVGEDRASATASAGAHTGDADNADTPEPTATPAAAPAAEPTNTVWAFEQPGPGPLPDGWSAPVGEWRLEAVDGAPSGSRVLVQTASNRSPVFNLALVDGSSDADVDIQVHLRARRGRIDQGGGVVWRAKDARNYYIARYNPLEDNLRVYTVKDGRRRQLDSADLRLDHGAWHVLRVTMTGDHIECYLDGQKHLDVRDTTFVDAGMVGLWTKADAQTEFDDLSLSGPDEVAP
ncbi:hypothetical protein [Haliangium sp.]|uniref:hypothetical protein n=1 Tax=Haliangium sp. TaxID=2663208 RepID=UPI003D0C5660